MYYKNHKSLDSMTKAELVDECTKLREAYAKSFASMELQYIWKHLNSQAELLELYRLLYNTNGNKSNIPSDKLSSFEREINDLIESFNEVKEGFEQFKGIYS